MRPATSLCALALTLLPLAAVATASKAIGSASVEGDDRLTTLFAAARSDPAQLVPLVLEASRTIAGLDGDEGHALATRLEPFSSRLFFGPAVVPGMERVGLRLHTVQPGELPSRIARRYSIGSGFLAYLNEGYDERRLQAGQKLKVLDLSGDDAFILIVDRDRHRVSAWCAAPDTDDWVLMAYVPVGLGAPETPTPSGTTRVTKRVLNPEWTDPVSGQVFAPDDPGNLLGGYWMALDAEGLGGRKGIGLHGYTGEEPQAWIGKNRSNGCIRMLQADIDRIYHLAVEGSSVRIVP